MPDALFEAPSLPAPRPKPKAPAVKILSPSAGDVVSGAQNVLQKNPQRVRQVRDLLRRGDFVETRDSRLCHPFRCYRRTAR